MSLKLRALMSVVALFISSLACATLAGESPAAKPEITGEDPVTETEAPISCPAITDRIMEISTTEDEEESLDEETYLVTYTVSGNEISDPQYEKVRAKLRDEQNDSITQQQIWDYFTALIPAEQRSVIGEYSIMTDGEGGTLAAVTQTLDDLGIWALEVDIADSRDHYGLTFTLIHEFGHLLTLGPDQVPPSLAVFNNPDDNDIYLEEVSKCPQYFPGEGCANPDAYINAYYDQFWAGLHEEWNKINLEENEDLYYEKIDDFYYKHEDQFVTSYAAINPEEDMAETWAFFVIGPKPKGHTIAEEKILFFHQHPELVRLREQILNNLCASLSE